MHSRKFLPGAVAVCGLEQGRVRRPAQTVSGSVGEGAQRIGSGPQDTKSWHFGPGSSCALKLVHELSRTGHVPKR
jgi:hypothetical protein